MTSSMPARWLVIRVDVPSGIDPGHLADVLVELGVGAVEERDGTLVTHLPEPRDPRDRVETIRRALREHSGVPSIEVSWSWQAHEEWAETWKRGLVPRRVGHRFLVAPTWVDVEPRPDDRVIRLDPGVAFGTAEHATTRASLVLLEHAVRPGDRIVDAGAGTGILAIGAVLLGAEEVLAVDSDLLASGAARENVDRNGVADRVRIVSRTLDAAALGETGPREGIVANIRSGILVELLPGAERALVPGGWLILSGILREEREAILEAAASFELREEIVEDEWWSGRFATPTVVRGGDAPRGR